MYWLVRKDRPLTLEFLKTPWKDPMVLEYAVDIITLLMLATPMGTIFYHHIVANDITLTFGGKAICQQAKRSTST
ncbi:hypothetical protein RHMOL_Rhmol12G0102700 [Rhododendron molle]|uniref:Uncharacterized protein n=1 Tax=Rhododendron molle TaxID=49168 RepID=A0ACC0LGL9_RHOML|nr:hypothetical protein RHMOL_Rhmol12G0102700 [Rhododendron molle]